MSEPRAAGGRDRDVRRGASRAPAGDRGCARHRASGPGAHLRIPTHAVVLGNFVEAGVDARAPARAARRARRRRDDRARLHARAWRSRSRRTSRASSWPERAWSSPAPDFRFGRKRRGDLELLEQLGYEVRAGAAARGRLVDRDPAAPARGRGAGGGAPARPAAGARRHRRRRRPARRHARLSDGEPRGRSGGCSCRAYGIYAGSALDHRAAISIGTNPHYGGEERRIEPHLLDFEGDLYGKRLVVELWERLRDEQVFESEQELVDQIARDVEATRGGRPARA